MGNEIITKENKSILSWDKNQMDLIKRTVAKGATDDEFNMFMYLAKTYQLDPITKEIWFIKYNATAVPIIMTSRDGYLAVANRNPHYEGLVSDVVHENDEFEKLPDGVKHKYGCKDRGKIIGAYAFGYRDDRKYPVYIFASFEEYFKKGSPIWVQFGSAMILKVAEAMMLKRLFSISGLVTKEEIAIEGDDGSIKIQAVPKDITPKSKVADMAFDPQNEGQVTEKEEEIIEKAMEQTQAEAIEEEERELGIENDRDREQVAMEEEEVKPADFKPASDKQKDYIYGTSTSKGIIESHLITKEEVKRIGLVEDLDIEKASKILAWWWGDKAKNIIGEREKREKNPKVGDSDFERRGILMKKVLDLMKENHIKPAEAKKMYKKYQKDEIIKLAFEELEELKALLENYVPNWK